MPRVSQPHHDPHLPLALEHRVDAPALANELAQLRSLIRKAGRSTTMEKLSPFTPAMAAAMLSLQLKKNRKHSAAWGARLDNILLEGRFGHAQIFVVDWDGNLCDGQHRLNSIVRTGVAVDAQWVMFGVDPNEFQTIDTGMRRNASQFLELEGVKYAQNVAAIIRFKHRIEHPGMPTLDDQAVYLQARAIADDLLSTAILAAARLRASQHVILSSAAWAYRTIVLSSKRAASVDDFWDHLVEGHMLGTDSPIHKLRKHFRKERDGKLRKGHQYLIQTQHAALIINAWNAWITNDTALARWTDPNSLPSVK